MSGYTLVGKGQPIRDAAAKVTGELLYTADIKLPRMLHAKVLFSPVAHAKIKNIDTSEAEALPGVRAVVHYKNTPNCYFNSCGEEIDGVKTEKVFDSTVRFVGDKVAAVAADNEKIAETALRLIKVEYEELPFYLQCEEAIAKDAIAIHEGGNIFEVVRQNCGDVEQALAEAEYVFEDVYDLPAIHHAAIETHAAIADYRADGSLTMYSTSQDVFAYRINLSRIFDIPMSRVRVIAPALGGGFGGKIDMVCDPIVAALSMQARRPVRLVYTRREDIPSSRCRHEMRVRVKMGVSADGTITAQDYDILVNAGAYAGATSSIIWAMCGKLFRMMKTPHIRFVGNGIYTNTTSAGAMRGFGSPQEFFAQQRMIYEISQKLGMDMCDILAKNLIERNGMDLRFNSPLGNTCAQDTLHKARDLFGYEAALAEVQETNKKGGRYRLGVGVATAAHGNGMYGVVPDSTGIILRMNEDGTAGFTTGFSDMGNGCVTSQQLVIAEILALPFESVSCLDADTGTGLWDLGNYGSRGTYVSVHAAVKAAQGMKEELLEEAASFLDCAKEELRVQEGSVVCQCGKRASYEQLVKHARARRELCVAETFVSNSMAVSYGTHIVKVRLDTETGEVKVLDYVAAHDVGYAINPLNVEGQIEGAVQMGLGYALSESIVRDEKGKVKNSTFRQYKIFRAKEMPPIHIAFVEEIEPGGPFGAKSIGECSVVPSAAAIGNAVSNAAGVNFTQLPLTPDRVKAGL